MTDSAYDDYSEILTLKSEDIVATKPRRALLTTLVVLYATLALLAIAIPQNLVTWAGDLKPSPAQEKLLKLAEELQETSSAIGIDKPYKWLRELFLTSTGKDPD